MPRLLQVRTVKEEGGIGYKPVAASYPKFGSSCSINLPTISDASAAAFEAMINVGACNYQEMSGEQGGTGWAEEA